ncbi:MAG: ribose-phosphate diphosphokinase [Myxococcota bacterium]
MGKPLVFSTETYRLLTGGIARELGADSGKIECRQFPDHERYHRIRTSPDGRHCVLVGGTIDDSNTLEIYDLACGLVEGGARRLTMVLPFLGYSTMERAVWPGEVVKAKTRARLFSSVPIAAEGNQVLLLDLHSEGLPYYFEGALNARHVYAKGLVLDACRRLADDPVLGCTDAGRAKWVESLALELGAEAAIVLKRRGADGSVVSGINAQVEGRRVVIYDDMIRSGSSLLGAAEVYHAAGAASVVAVCTHGLFPGDALQQIRASGLVERVVCTDSHPRANSLADEFLEVVSVAPTLARALGAA